MIAPPRIAVVDVEATGLGPDATPCEIGLCELVATDRDLAGRATGWEVDATALPCGGFLVDPGQPIPPEASAVHHITDDDIMIAAKVDWRTGIRWLLAESHHMVLAAHNADFEKRFIDDEASRRRPWIDTWKCALRLWPEAPAHGNQALRYWLQPEGLDREIADTSHRAFPDAYVTAHLLLDLLAEVSLDRLIAWSAEPALLVRIPFRSHRGTRWRDIDDGFLDWVLARDFDADVMFTARHERDRRREERDLARLADGGGPAE